MAIQDFTAGQVLTAAQMDALQANDYNQTVSTKTDSYVLTAADKGTRLVMNAATAKTFTVNSGLFAAGDTLFLQNIGAGTATVTAGTCTVTTAGSLALAQWGGGTLYFTSASAAIFFSGGGLVYGTATGGTGVLSTTVGGVSYNYTSFTSTGTLTLTKAGVFDVLVFGGGSGGHGDNNYGGGGGSGGISLQTIYLSANATVTIGAGGAADAAGNPSSVGTIPNAIATAGGIYVTLTNRTAQLGPSQGSTGGNTLPATNVQGYTGGSSNTNAGGGGGSTTVVGSNAPSSGVGGAGGAGYDVGTNFIGTAALFKGAGGGGGAATTGGLGGSSIGGNGASGATNGTTPAANTASGGGGRGLAGLTTAGSSGIVYVRWKV
jgi:hypothetical protein